MTVSSDSIESEISQINTSDGVLCWSKREVNLRKVTLTVNKTNSPPAGDVVVVRVRDEAVGGSPSKEIFQIVGRLSYIASINGSKRTEHTIFTDRCRRQTNMMYDR